MNTGFIKLSDKKGFFVENEPNTPYTENGFLHYGYFVEYCVYIPDNGFMAVMHTVVNNQSELDEIMKAPRKYMSRYYRPQRIGL